MAMGVGLWNSATGKYLLPGPAATATQPGGAGIATNPAAFFNVAFGTAEPFPSETAETGAVLDPAWWRDQEQGTALAQGNISPFYANVSCAKLLNDVTGNSDVPTTGPMDRSSATARTGRS